MREIELESKRITLFPQEKVDRVEELKRWFRFDYRDRLDKINRYAYLGLESPESRWELETEAYKKENELRLLEGKQPLPELKFKDLL